MVETKRLPRLTAGLGLVAVLVAGACAPQQGNAGNAGGGELSGQVAVSGSSTVEPISSAVAQKFNAENPSVQISVDGPGTGDGFELFCQGDTDISDASRPIDDEEIENCEANGIEFIELKVAIDGIAVLTSPQGTEVAECLSFVDLYSLLGPESQGFKTWADANELNRELGGDGGFPSEPLVVTAPGQESGTYDSFVEIVMEDIAEEREVSEEREFVRPDYQASGDDNVIIQGIANNPTSLGWVGYAFYVTNQDTVAAFPTSEEEGGDCVEPTEETIASGDYPIARDLYIYVNAANAEQNQSLAAYVDFYLTDAGLVESTQEVGYVVLPQETIDETRQVWEDREVGRHFSG